MFRLLVVAALFAPLLTAPGAAVAASGHASRPPSARLEGTVVWPPGSRPAPDFSLRDQNGRLMSRAGLKGHVWAITFLDSRCRQACPVAAHALGLVNRMVGRSHPWSIVIVSVLPQYDRPSTVRAFARKTGLSGDWHWLLGTKSQLMPVWIDYGIDVITGAQHTAALYLVDAQGDVRVADGVPFIPRQLAASVRALDALRMSSHGGH